MEPEKKISVGDKKIPADRRIKYLKEVLKKEIEAFRKDTIYNREMFEKIFQKYLNEYLEKYNSNIINEFKNLIEKIKDGMSKEDFRFNEISVKDIDVDNGILYPLENSEGYNTNGINTEDFAKISAKTQGIEQGSSQKELLTIKNIEEKIKEDTIKVKEDLGKLKEELKESKKCEEEINNAVEAIDSMDNYEEDILNVNGRNINRLFSYLYKIKANSSKESYQNEWNKIAGTHEEWTKGGYTKVKGMGPLSSNAEKYSEPSNVEEIFKEWNICDDPEKLENGGYCIDDSYVYLSEKEGGKIPNEYYQLAYNKKAKQALELEVDSLMNDEVYDEEG